FAGSVAPLSHAFVAKLNPNAASASSSLSYSVYLGGVGCNTPSTATNQNGPCLFNETDTGVSIAVDAFGNAYVAGTTASPTRVTNTTTAGSPPSTNLLYTPTTTVFTAPVGADGAAGATGQAGAGVVTALSIVKAGAGYNAAAVHPLDFNTGQCQVPPQGIA